MVKERSADVLSGDGESVEPQENLEHARVLGLAAPLEQADELGVGTRWIRPDRGLPAVSGSLRARDQALVAKGLQHPRTYWSPSLGRGLKQRLTVEFSRQFKGVGCRHEFQASF